MFSKRAVAKALASLAALCSAIAVLLWLSALHTERTASRFLSDFVRVEVGRSGFMGARDLVESYPEAVRTEIKYLGTNSRDCTQECNFAFLFENGWLRRLRLAPPVWIRANVLVENGTVTHKNVQMGCGRGPTHFLVSISEAVATEGMQPYSVTDRRSDDIDWRVAVELTSQASKEQREKAYTLNVGRLAELHSCKDASELSPLTPTQKK